MTAVEEGDRTWPEVAPEVASQKAKKILVQRVNCYSFNVCDILNNIAYR